MPLYLEALGMALVGFGAGIFFAYLVALRRHWIR